MVKINRYLFLIVVFGINNFSFAQTPEEVSKVFPDADVVYTNYNKNLNIFFKDGVPAAESRMDIDMMMMSDKNSNMISRYSVYHSSYNSLNGLEAYTKIPNGKKYKNLKVTDIKTSVSTQTSVFYDDGQESTFDFPGLTQYSVAHVNYNLFHKDAHLLTPFYIPESLPIYNATFSVSVPAGIYIKYIVKNDPEGQFVFSVEKSKKETVYKWTMANRKPLSFYYDAPDFRYYVPHVIVYITGFEKDNVHQPFLGNINELYEWNYSFTKELNKTSIPQLKTLVDSLTKNENVDLNKANAIYRWVQNHIKYIAFENDIEGFRPRQAEDVFSKRYGDCKDMSSLLTTMLKIAGLPAYYTWIGTRDIPYLYSELPSPIVDNHMISSLNLNGKWYFVDGTNSFANLELPPAFIQGKEALVAKNEKEFEIVKVPVADPSSSVINDSTFIWVTPNGIKGFENVDYSGYFSEDVYSTIAYKDEKGLEKYVKGRMGKASNKFILGNYKINKTNPDLHLINISADFEIPDYGKKAGENYFINLNLEKLLENRIIDLEKRKIPVENEFKYVIRQNHILNIPEGYTITEVPKDFEIDNDFISFKINYKSDKKRLIATQELINKTLILFPSDFEKWNKDIKTTMPKYKELIVLEKIK